MPAIYLQDPLSQEEMDALRQEFPLYELLTSYSDENLERAEVFYGNQFSEQDLELAHRLKWIHCTNADVDALPLKEIRSKEKILITMSKGSQSSHIAEFVMGAILAFAKQLFQWTSVSHNSEEFLDSPLRSTMWSLQGKTLLQIGLGEVGTGIVKYANLFGMRTWGVRRQRSFHPYCHKTFTLESLHSLLPSSDVIVVAMPKVSKDQSKKILFSEHEFTMMKPDSIFILIGPSDAIDEEAAAKIAATGKFRGMLLDTFRTPPSEDSPLWSMPNGILTPSISSFPLSTVHSAFKLFRKNFRLFISGRINEMKNLVSAK